MVDGTTGACTEAPPTTTTDPCKFDKERLNEEWKKITRDSDGKFHDSRVRSKRIKAQISSSSITKIIRIFHKRPYQKFLQS